MKTSVVARRRHDSSADVLVVDLTIADPDGDCTARE
jgi:hypothetical protein